MSLTEILEFLSGDFDSRLQAGYIAACLLAVALVLSPMPGRRRRQRRRAAREAALSSGQEHSTLRNRAAAISERGRAWMEGPGPGAILHLLVFVGTATAALIGWRIPAEIERLYGDGAGFGLIFPNVTMPTIGRLAQVVGALAFALVALRFLRFLIPLIALASIAIVAILAGQYIMGVPIGL